MLSWSRHTRRAPSKITARGLRPKTNIPFPPKSHANVPPSYRTPANWRPTSDGVLSSPAASRNGVSRPYPHPTHPPRDIVEMLKRSAGTADRGRSATSRLRLVINLSSAVRYRICRESLFTRSLRRTVDPPEVGPQLSHSECGATWHGNGSSGGKESVPCGSHWLME